MLKLIFEYEWKPARCKTTCKVFDRNDDGCPKSVEPVVQDKSLVDEEGFVEIIRTKEKVSSRVLIVRLMGFVFKSLKFRITIGRLLSKRMEKHRRLNLSNRIQVLQRLMQVLLLTNLLLILLVVRVEKSDTGLKQTRD